MGTFDPSTFRDRYQDLCARIVLAELHSDSGEFEVRATTRALRIKRLAAQLLADFIMGGGFGKPSGGVRPASVDAHGRSLRASAEAARASVPFSSDHARSDLPGPVSLRISRKASSRRSRFVARGSPPRRLAGFFSTFGTAQVCDTSPSFGIAARRSSLASPTARNADSRTGTAAPSWVYAVSQIAEPSSLTMARAAGSGIAV
jgi:hypothetical protein